MPRNHFLPVKIRKLLFLLTPTRWRSPFCQDDPWLTHYEIGEWTYGRIKVLGWGHKATLRIGKFCSLGGGTTIFVDDGEHKPSSVSVYPLRLALPGLEIPEHTVAGKGDVEIGHDVWVGDAATILSGVRIGNGAVIGTRAVVAKDVPAYAIAVGNPARVVRMRFTPEQIAALEKMTWWNWPLEKIRAAAPLLNSGSITEFIARYS